MEIIRQTNISDYKLFSKGKVRDIYEVDNNTLLIVTTDRMSAFDVIMHEPIPYKGVVLNQLTLFWLKRFSKLIANHLLENNICNYPEPLKKYASMLEGRSMLVKKAKPLPIECIVRGYLSGSAWADYQKSGAVCGYTLPKNLFNSDKLEKPLFTPSTKAELGKHDQNISIAEAEKLIGKDLVEKVEKKSLLLYEQARDYALECGIIIADTKFEFGLLGGELILIDEVLTPDSSRFWAKDSYKAGTSQPSFDKQYLRDWLSKQDWNKTPPPPTLPTDVITETKNKYINAYKYITKSELIINQY